MALGASREGGFWTLGVGWIGGGAGKPCLWTPGLPELLGKGYCGPSLSGVGLGQAEGSWSQTSELPGEGRGRKGTCCCREFRDRDTGDSELPEWAERGVPGKGLGREPVGEGCYELLRPGLEGSLDHSCPGEEMGSRVLAAFT